MRTAILTFPFVLLLLAHPPATAQRDAKIPDPDPEIERKSFRVADGYEVNLFAADPLLAKPIQMNFDALGRLWIASSETYPQIKPGQKANDKILILEDTKGVGKADKVTVFADGLLIPTGIEPGDGGAYVANSTELIHLSDTDGDGKADKRRVVLSGFGTEDTHHILHTLRWGHDGNLYMNQSVYIHSHIETPFGPRRLNAGGVWQLRPDTLKLEVFARGIWNTWGHHFDRYGQSFLTDGAGFQGVLYGFPGAAYDPLPPGSPPRVLPGLNPGSPKYCGLEIVSGRHLAEWDGNLVTCDFRAHRVCRFVLTPSGSGYTARLMPDIIKATHPAFRPIDVKMGPDGALYVADWYNPIIQHGEVDFRDPRRDVTHGRIWRVTKKGRAPLLRLDLAKATPAELVKMLGSEEGWTSHHARRVLKEKHAKEAVVALQEARGVNILQILWAYQTLDVVDLDILNDLLNDKIDGVRAAAVRVLSAWRDRVPNAMTHLERLVGDEHPQVRLEAVRALGLMNSSRAAELALRALDKPLDGNLDFALWLTMRELEAAWLPALEAGKFDFGGDAKRLAFALQAVGSDKVIRPLVQLVKTAKLSPEAEEGVLVLLAGVGGAGEAELVLGSAMAAKSAERQARLLAALEEASRQRGVTPSGDRKGILPLIGASDEAARLAGLWKIAEARDKLAALAQDEKSPRRRAAIDGLAALGGQASKNTLAALTDKGDLETRRFALVALAGLDTPLAAERAASVLSAGKDAGGAADVFAAFLERKGGPALLAKALVGKKLPPDVAKVGVRAARVSGRPSPELADALLKAGGLENPSRVLSPEQMRQFLDDVAKTGDAARGEAVFRRADQMCLKCHAFGGAGGLVGPDLSSIGAATQPDYLVESLLLPAKAIKENYHAILVTTTKGRQLTGIKVRQTTTALVLRDDQDREVAVPLKEVEEQGPSRVSLMPEGLTDTLTRAELVDLVRFLTELGKGERWSVGRAKPARRWQALTPNAEAYRMLNRLGMNAMAGDGANLAWEPAYSTVAGALPVAELPWLRVGKEGPKFSVVRARLDAASACEINLTLASAKGLTLWLDGTPVTPKASVPLTLSAGAHTLTVAIDRREAGPALRVEVEDTLAAAGVRFTGGK